MAFFYGLQIFISVCLIIVVLFQRSSSDSVISSSVNSYVGDAGFFIRKFTVFLIFCFFLNCLYLARDRGMGQNSSKHLISSLESQTMIEEDKAADTYMSRY